MRHLLSLFDINQAELQTVLSISDQVKSLLSAGQRPAWLARHVLAMLFEKPSLRTRVSFEAGFSQMGGTTMFLGQEVGWQKREPTADFIQVLAQYVDVVVCRSKLHASVEELASFNCVPVINGLTDLSHPCQALADLLTMRENANGSLNGKQVTFVGDGNNVSRSLALACAMVGMRFRLLGPKEYFMSDESIAAITNRYPTSDLCQSESAKDALDSADFAYTDVWTSMGQEQESVARKSAFAPYQLNGDLLRNAPASCKILHCLPAKRGEEITGQLMDSPNSAVYQQAGNRMHAQKGLLLWLALQHEQITPDQLKSEGIDLHSDSL